MTNKITQIKLSGDYYTSLMTKQGTPAVIWECSQLNYKTQYYALAIEGKGTILKKATISTIIDILNEN